MIIGSTNNLRRQRAAEIVKEYSSLFDTHFLDTEITKGIGAVREATKNLNKKPFNSKFGSLVIFEAQNLTIEAQNALLKTLEEPSSSTKIVLTAPTKESLLSTMVSRCRELFLLDDYQSLDETKISDQFLAESFYTRWKNADKLDIDLWLLFWRKILLKCTTNNGDFLNVQSIRRVHNYIKLIFKAKKILKRRASPKLVKNFLLLNAPIGVIKKDP